jgi:hypothetical protein
MPTVLISDVPVVIPDDGQFHSVMTCMRGNETTVWVDNVKQKPVMLPAIVLKKPCHFDPL